MKIKDDNGDVIFELRIPLTPQAIKIYLDDAYTLRFPSIIKKRERHFCPPALLLTYHPIGIVAINSECYYIPNTLLCIHRFNIFLYPFPITNPTLINN